MKKALLASSALVAAGALLTANEAVAQFEVSVNGNAHQYFSIADNDIDDIHPANQFSNVEVHFNFSQTLDNGIEIGGRVELEGETTGDTIDEQYLFVEGSFGTVVIGSENSAGYRMAIGAPSVGGIGINSGTVSSVVVNPGVGGLFRAPGGSTFNEPFRSNDAFSITYFSPRFNGVQVGVSYIPHIGDQDSDALFNTETQPTDGVTGGINYVGSFGAVDVTVGGTLLYGSAPDAGGNEDYFGFTAGAEVGFAGFALGGGYAEATEGEIGAQSFEGRGFHVGATYETGPWGVGIQYFDGKTEQVVGGGDDEYRVVQGSAQYALGPGVRATFDLGYADFEDETGADNDGVYGVLGLETNF